MTSFAEFDLHPRLVETLGRLEMETPTEVQRGVLPLVKSGSDVLVCAETGSGKTFAYLLPVVSRLLADPSLKGQASPFCLVLLPTRELADQVYKQCLLLCESTGIRALLLSGGQEFPYQAALLRRNPEIVIATPGRIADHLARKTIDLSAVSCLVLDEADRMLDMGFRDAVLAIAGGIEKDHQTLLLSATLKHRGIGAIAASILDKPEKILLSSGREVNRNIKMQMLLADDASHKIRLLVWLLANEPYRRALVFVKTRETAEEVTRELQRHSHRASFLHGEVKQDARRKIMAGFREGKFSVLVATDLAARGLDVQELDLVINVDMAQSGDEFVHRAGRTGRTEGQEGLVVSLVSSPEWNLTAGIQRYMGATFERRKIAGLEGSYKGPKKIKSSGKAAGPKKKKADKKPGISGAGKAGPVSVKKPASVKKAHSVAGKTTGDRKIEGKPSRHGTTRVSDEGFKPFSPKGRA